MPYTVVVADFQQLQPVVSGGLCRNFCEKMQTVELKTVYRSRDESHLIFLNRIRCDQPERPMLEEYFGERHWKSVSMETAVDRGMQLAKEAGEPFSWLTCTNAGAAEVCKAALRHKGITDEELQSGYFRTRRLSPLCKFWRGLVSSFA